MVLGKCFQVSSVSTAGVGVRHPHYPFGCKKQPNPAKAKGLTKPIKAFSSAPSLALSFHHSCLRSSSSLICKAHETVNEAQVVTDSSWEKLVVASERPVLVEFWAPWCGPCRMIAPVIDELAREYAGKIACFKLNTDDCPDIATQCGIRSIPTVLFFKDGQKKESIIGAVPKSTLSATIDKYLIL